MDFFKAKDKLDKFLSKISTNLLEEIFIEKDISDEEKEKIYDNLTSNYKAKGERLFRTCEKFNEMFGR